MILSDIYIDIKGSDNLKLYSTDCPKCKILEKKLINKHISFEKITDFDYDEMKEKGFNFAPILEIDGGILMNFSDANNYINSL